MVFSVSVLYPYFTPAGGVAAYTLSRHGVHIGRLKKGNKIKKKCIVTFNSLIKSV
jgi:flavin-dependent dehydrogenase